MAALDAGIDQKILRRVSRSPGELSDIKSIWKDAGRLEGHHMRAIRDAITRFSEIARSEDWD